MLEIYLLVGVVAGLLGGLLGVGGGLIIVPALFEVFVFLNFDQSVQMHMAIATSLATIIFISAASAWTHHRHGAVLWQSWWRLTPAILIGGAAGAAIAEYMPTALLKNVFAIFEIIVAIQMAFSVRPDAGRDLPGRAGMSVGGFLIGAISAIIGIGGGTMTVPFLTWCRVSIHNAVATSAACGLPIAVSGTITYMILGYGMPSLPQDSSGYIYWPALLSIAVSSLVFAPLGAVLAHRLPVALLKKIFALILFLIGLRLLLV